MAKENKKKTSDDVIKELNKLYGAGTMFNITEDTPISKFETISTGSLGLNKATGIGGVPRGRIIEIYGPEASGKTTLATHILSNAQKLGKVAVLDIEHSYSPEYAFDIGLSRNLSFSQPEWGEQSFDAMKMLLDTGEYSAILLDSVAGNIPKEQYEGESGQSRLARLAALMSMEVPKIAIKASKNNCLVIFNNQLRNNIGGYGNPEKPAGGDALKYYASMRMDIRKKVEHEEFRNKTTVKIVKNKCASPYGQAEFYIDWGTGINKCAEIFDLAVDNNIIEMAGSWYSYNGSKVQGADSMLSLLIDNPEYYQEIEKKVLLSLQLV